MIRIEVWSLPSFINQKQKESWKQIAKFAPLGADPFVPSEMFFQEVCLFCCVQSYREKEF